MNQTLSSEPSVSSGSFQIPLNLRTALSNLGWYLSARYETIDALHAEVSDAVMDFFGFSQTEEINQGACFIWAWLCSLYSNQITLVASTNDHAGIAYQGSLFDCEGELRTNPQQYASMDPTDFVEYWSSVGVQASVFEKIVKACQSCNHPRTEA